MKIKEYDLIDEIINKFSLKNKGAVYEDDLDIITNPTEFNNRKKLDALVLATVSANCDGNCLDIGTSLGRSAYRIATNINSINKVFTVNILPEQANKNTDLITHLLNKEEIGKFFREKHIQNIVQVYADTLTWKVPENIENLSLVYVDLEHDEEAVFMDSVKFWKKLKEGGFILWHDFSPQKINKFHRIDAAMKGVERFVNYFQLDEEVIHLKDSWIGILQKKSKSHIRRSLKNYQEC